MLDNSESLKQQVLINHFTNATGCTVDQAIQLLQDSRWQFEIALSSFFQETSVTPHTHQRTGLNPLCAPSNTPATPPSFTDALLALHKLGTTTQTTSDSGSVGGNNTTTNNNNNVGGWIQPAPPKVLQPINPVNSMDRHTMTFMAEPSGCVDMESSDVGDPQQQQQQQQHAQTPTTAQLMFPIEAHQ